jgi:hypothetical protein
MPRRQSPYGGRYRKVRAALLGQPCEMRLVCEGSPADSADHDPPLSRHEHVEGSGCCALRPACMACQHRQRRTLAGQTRYLQARGISIPRQMGKVDLAGIMERVYW